MCEHSTKVRCGRAVEERVLRSGARALLAQAIEAEVSGFLSSHADKLTDGRQRLVRHGASARA